MKPLLVPGGRAFVWPTIQQVQRLVEFDHIPGEKNFGLPSFF